MSTVYICEGKRRIRTEQNGPLFFLMIPGVFSHGQFKVFFQYMISIEFSSQEVYFLLHRSNKPNPYPIIDNAGMTLLSHFFFIFIEVSLQYNVMLVSSVQQGDSVIYVFFFIFFSIMIYCRILNIVFCAI